MAELFCPIYKEACDQKPWENDSNANRGLLFDKFASAWLKQNDNYEFDKGGGKKEGSGDWLRKMAKSNPGNGNMLEEACQRQRNLAKAMGGIALQITNSSRFITGMGREHPLENGFAWHHTLGVPYLPGSSLKGVLRSWYRESRGEFHGKWREDSLTESLFGSQQNGVGQFLLLDMLPTRPPKLVIDIMTPHYGPYYQDDSGKTAPGDWHSPIPISFLAVEADQSWQLALLPGPNHRTASKEEFNLLQDRFLEALDWLGAGAKTAVGYGRFEKGWKAEQQVQKQEEQRLKKLADKKALDEKLSGLSQDVVELVKLSIKDSWLIDKQKRDSFLDGIDNYLKDNPQPTVACIEWIRDNALEFFWSGIWKDPEAMSGKKKDKPKHKSKRARELTKKLKDLL